MLGKESFKISNLCAFLLLLSIGETQVPGELEVFDTWTLSKATLATSDRNIRAVYDYDFNHELIWLIGGVSCRNCVNFYNISNDSVHYYDTLSGQAASPNSLPSGVMIDEMVYFIDYDSELFSYNITSKTTTTLTSISPTSTRPCLNKNSDSNNRQLYMTAGISSDRFYVYNVSDMTLTQGNSLSSSRNNPTCIVNDYFGTSYLYVVAGQSVNIERIELNENIVNNEWETLSITLNDIDGSSLSMNNLYVSSGIAYLNYLILIGGYDGSITTDEILYIDITPNAFDAGIAAYFPQQRLSMGVVTAKSIHNDNNDTVFAFGGASNVITGTPVLVNTIYYNLIPPTFAPSVMPSTEPTQLPSESPSMQPSGIPSLIPSMNPSNQPSLTPSNYPSVIPTINPTQGDYSTNYTNTNGCDEIDGGDWILVRRVSEYDNAWHPINDDLKGNETYGVYSSDAQANSTWSINFEDMVSNYNQFLLATGNCDYWLVTNVDQATTKGCLACDRCILNSSSIALSSYGNLPYYAEWYNRDNLLGATNEDPWISVHDHIEGASDNGEAEIVYGENAHSINHLIPMIYNNGGNVWIRKNENETRYCGMTHEPSVSPTSQPSISPTDDDDKKEKGKCGDNDEFTYCDNHHYIGVYSNTTSVTWYEAFAICEAIFGTSLASIHNAEDNDNVKDAALCAGSNDGYKWIGLNDMRNETTFEWIDDSVVNYTNWLVNQPSGNGDCVSFHHQTTWGDNPCHNTYNSFICNLHDKHSC